MLATSKLPDVGNILKVICLLDKLNDLPSLVPYVLVSDLLQVSNKATLEGNSQTVPSRILRTSAWLAVSVDSPSCMA